MISIPCGEIGSKAGQAITSRASTQISIPCGEIGRMVENEKQEQKFIFQFLVVRLGVAA